MANREQEALKQSLMIARIARRYERQIARSIGSAMVKSANLIMQGQPYNFVEYEHKTEITKLIYALYRDTAERFVEYNATGQKSKYGPRYHKYNIPLNQIVSMIMAEWAVANGGVLITQITTQTMNKINELVDQSFRDGLTEKELAKLIKSVAPNKSASRAQTIARTEAHRAANASGFMTQKASGFERVKIWSASLGARTRDDHKEADRDYREGIPMDDYFIVGGSRLMYTGDPSAPAHQTINCRCVTLYDTV